MDQASRSAARGCRSLWRERRVPHLLRRGANVPGTDQGRGRGGGNARRLRFLRLAAGVQRCGPGMNRILFVYGTLMSSASHSMGARLGRQARLIGSASIAGKLYLLGSYPGLVETDDGVSRVWGEVFELEDAARS